MRSFRDFLSDAYAYERARDEEEERLKAGGAPKAEAKPAARPTYAPTVKAPFPAPARPAPKASPATPAPPATTLDDIDF